jgi:hypothetical protein
MPAYYANQFQQPRLSRLVEFLTLLHVLLLVEASVVAKQLAQMVLKAIG